MNLSQTQVDTSLLRLYISKYALPVILLLIPFSLFYPKHIFSNVLIILLTLLWVAEGNLKIKAQHILKRKWVLLFVGTYFIYVLGLTYSENIITGLTLIEKKVALFIFPIVLSTFSISEKLLKKIMFSFVLASLLATLHPLLRIGFHDMSSDEAVAAMLFRDEFTALAGLDVPYFALFIDLAIFLLTSLMIKDWSKLNWMIKLVGLLVLGLFTAVNILLSARMPILVLFLVAVVACFYFAWSNKRTIILLVIGLLAIVALSFWKFNFLSARFKEIAQTKWEPPVGVYYNSTNLRIGSITCALSLLKDHWALGVGTGDAQQNLNHCYEVNQYSGVMYIDEYNTHNEYLNVWLSLGVIGLLVFVSSLLIPIREALVKRDHVYLIFLGLMVMTFLTECILERQKGVIFFSFFNSLLAFNFGGIQLLTKRTETIAK
jgi:O-antigen ligase